MRDFIHTGFDEADEERATRPALSPGKRTLASRLVMRRASDGAPPVAADAALEQAAGGGGAPPDPAVAGRVEATTGADLSGVRVHTDAASARAASAVHAKAYTVGANIHFASAQYDPGTPAGDELLAHELVHTVQQGDAASKPQLKGTQISEAGDAAELEADRIARVALSGGEPTGAPIERAAPVARVPETLSGNPAELTDSTGAATTTHRAAGLGDAANPPTATAAATESRTANVQVKADASSKLHLEPPVCPLPSRIYEEDASAASPAPAGFQTVTGLNGTVAAPIVTQEANKSLYINGQPTADDVQQAGIGDCYFLAAVMSVVSRDPGKITSMISPDGNGGGTVMFWRAQTHAPTILERIMGGAPERDWIQVAVTVNDTLAFDIANNQVHGAQLRCAPGPKAADYWGDVQGTTLEIHRHDEFECARWAPILEKAYALFSQNHSNNGGARPNGTTGASGYDAINGGWSYEALCVFYGPQSDAAGADLKQQDTNFNPGAASQVVANAPVMEQLALLQGRGTQTRPGETDAPIVTATSSVAPLIGRLTAAIPVAQADADYANVDAGRQASVGTVATSVATYNATPPDPAGVPGPEAAALAAVGNACVDAVAPGLTESSGRAEVMRNITGWNPSPITFGSGDDVVPPAAATDLGNMNSWMISNRHPQVAIQIDGHSSTVGDAATNQDLSQRRADNVETALVAGGAIAPHTSAKTAHGEAGATADPAWQKVVVGVTHTGHNTNTLLDPLRSTPIRQMTDLMLDLRNIGTDSSSGQRNIYGDHVYSVVGVNIVTTSGVTVPLNAVPAQFRSLLYPLVDGDVSTVLLRNPHHGNEPDRMDSNTPSRPGDGAPSEAGSDGNFTMSLNEFFLNFTAVDSGVFPRS